METTCPVQAQHNADERKAEANDIASIDAELADIAAINAANPVAAAIERIPKCKRTKRTYQYIISSLRCQMEQEIPECGYALDGMLDAFRGIDK